MKKIFSISYILFILVIFIIFDYLFGYLIGSRKYSVNHRYLPNNTLNHVMVKDYKSKIRPHEDLDPFVFQTNSIGLKNEEIITNEKDKKLYTIILMGDSFVESYDPNRSIKSIIFNKLKDLQINMDIQIINAGISSYSPILHFFHYKYVLNKLNPDMVILCIDVTDIRDDYYYSNFVQYNNSDKNPIGVGNERNYKKKLTLKNMGENNPIFSKHWLVSKFTQHSNIFSYYIFSPRENMYFRMYGKNSLKIQQIDDYIGIALGKHENSRDAYKVTFEYLDRLIDILKYDNVEVIVSIYPHKELVKSENKYYSNQIMSYFSKKQIPIHDLYDAVASLERVDSLYLNKNMHFNYDGISLWGRELAQYLLPHIIN